MDNMNKNRDDGLTEIDIGNFLGKNGKDSTLYDGFHEDIQKTEKSLENELQSLYDDIMSSGPATIVPKPISVIASEQKKPEPKKAEVKPQKSWGTDFDELEEPSAPAEKKPEPPKAKPVQKNEPAKPSAPAEDSKDDIFSLIASLKSDTEKEKGFGNILSEIEANPEINSAKPQEAPKPKPVQKAAVPEIKKTAPAEPKPEKKFTVSIPEPSETVEVEDIFAEKKPQKPRKAQKPKKPESQKSEDGKMPKSEIIRRIVLTVSIIVIIISSGVLVNTYIVQPYIFKKNSQDIVDNFDVDNTEVVSDNASAEEGEYPEGMLAKYKNLYDINSDVAGWISIPGLEINLPITKGKDNSYYLHRNIYKKYTDYGVPYFDFRMNDLKNLHRNNVIYGHNMRHDDLIFGMLENYRKIEYFKKNPVIECNTIYGDHTWFICAVFMTNSKAAQDNGYIFPYNFIDIDDSKFFDYLSEIKKRSFYDTGVDVNVNDKLLTLSTCCYDFSDARLVVVAREKRANESANIDVSSAVLNPNPKYPQAWYDANNKTNPYVNDARW